MNVFKILVPTTLAVTVIAPPVIIAAIEAANPKGIFDEQARKLEEVALDEFLTLCPIPHPTFGTRGICDHIKNRLKEAGYTETKSLKDIDDCLHFYEDDYRANDPTFGQEASSGNLLFEIPATKGREQTPGIVLQSHMDMVLDGVDHEHALTTKVEPIIDGNTVHSKDFKTSLGADDGTGLALILALVKQPDIVAHGPLRCIITADEEDGVSGASEITYEGLKYKYFLNLDNENVRDITVSAAGTRDFVFHIDSIHSTFIENGIKQGTHEYKIIVKDLQGGHSASEINNGQASAIQLVDDVIIAIRNVTPVHGSFSLVSMEANNLSNAICTEASANIISSLPYDNDDVCIKNILNIEVDRFKKNYPIETDIKIECEEITGDDRANYHLNHDGSNNIAELIPTLPFGPLSWLDIERKEVETSANLSALKLDFSHMGSEANPHFQIECLVRSSYQPSIGIIEGYFRQQAYEYLTAMLTNPEQKPLRIDSATPPWEPIRDEEYWTFVTSAMADAQIKNIKKTNSHGWLEVGFFWLRYKENEVIPHIVSLGPTINNCHNVKETLYLDTYQPFIQTVLYIIYMIDTLFLL